MCISSSGVYTLLTDTKLRKALGKKRDQIEVISDAHGLNVRLSTSGSITFFYRYRWNGKAAQLTIGDYPTTSLSQARERRQQFRAWLTEGLDPRRQTVLEKQKKVEALTVKEAFDYWEKYYCIPEGLVKIKVNRRDFNNHIAPVLGNMIVDQTTKAHWLNLFDGMGRRVVTGQMLGLMQRTFRFCSNRGVTLVADPYEPRLSKLELGEVNDWNFTAADGTVIEGRCYLPPHFDPAKKYPLIVYYYGGTSPTQRTFESTYPLQVYAGMDYVVYAINPSGTTGYGQEFAARHVNAWGKMTADEIIEGTRQFVAAHPYVDGRKMACIGASYGGFMTQYVITRTDMFAAAVSHAGISSLASYWGEGYWGYTYSAGASTGSYPWNNKELYTEQSPLFHADKIKTPLLLTHGTADTNVPPGESIQMYTALKILGKPVEFVQVEGENHIILDFKKRIEWNHTIYAWFAKWLKNDSGWWNELYGDK